ncbi:Single-stranded DNA-binding protein RIM1, mitochondrial [Daldinia childiae]|uniref:Single-stranded DNA-binding protein RIM1, mitochondrial n=1 Tax=Daldinia childiae TaxID=326645 RepID=UPI001445DA80|nr:Single-stranded DNA-binding protein RIM1, mitochondrial [Daldinia childiae]KAF3064767.1 Single-stranded DNA-binding protein RIM1, mitochondrial [Daldinia childiae]
MSFLARRATAAAPGLARAFSASARRDVAKITLVGNLAAPPEVRATSTGREVIEYAVASNYGSKENRQTSWFRVAAFIEEGPRREFLTSLPKGATVYVEGDAIMNNFTDADGKSRNALSIYQKTIEVLKRPTPTE